MKNQKLAVLDLGTNTFHLLIADIKSRKHYTIVLNEKIPVMIGKGGISHGYITEEAQERAINALRQFRQIMDMHEVQRLYATATSAFRNAKNGQELVDRIKQAIDIVIHIIPGEQEATYIYRGVKEALPLGKENAMIIDIGGGSVEFIICNANTLLWKHSFEIGAQRLLDQFMFTDPMQQKDIERMTRYFDEQLSALDAACRQYQPKTLIGASGAFDTFSEIHAHKAGIVIQDGQTELPLAIESFWQIHQELTQKNQEERRRVPGMIEMRVDMIVVASWLVSYVLMRYQIADIRIAAYALKEGLLREVIDKEMEQ